LSIGAPIEAVLCDDLDASVAATTAVYTRCIEQAIRRNPVQWNWLGLPRRGGQLSRAETARLEQEALKASAAPSRTEVRKTGTSA
jgi:hypothetical protein